LNEEPSISITRHAAPIFYKANQTMANGIEDHPSVSKKKHAMDFKQK
jgi:hypothetical protein